MMTQLKDKVALVTGAARGLGAATARQLAEAGAKVVLTDMSVDEGEETASRIREGGGDVIFAAHDVTSESDWQKVTDLAVERYSGLHIMVNNAGIAPFGKPIEDLTLEEWRHVMAVDLDSVFLGCKYAFRNMKQTGGSIINISSIMGMIGMVNGAEYNAAKGGVRLLTKVAALEGAAYGIRVNSIHPGFVDTMLVRNAVGTSVAEGRMEGLSNANEVMDMLTMRHPIGRLGVPDDIASTVVFLAGEASAFMTGSELVVDGGYTAQ